MPAAAGGRARRTRTLILQSADLSLDGSRSSGGGVKKLSYNWRAHPTKCDNYVAVQAALDAQGDVPTVHLGGAALDGGSAFVFLLVVSNFLGEASEEATFEVDRAALPIPAVLIDAPPLLVVRRAARGAPRFGLAPRLPRRPPDSVRVEQHGGRRRRRRALRADCRRQRRAAALRRPARRRRVAAPRVTYTLSVRGCLVDGASLACATAATAVTLLDEPLRAAIAGGDRVVGEDSGLELDACSSVDPDDPDAPLAFGWECAPYEGVGACGVTPPAAEAAGACAWALPPRALAPGAASSTSSCPRRAATLRTRASP